NATSDKAITYATQDVKSVSPDMDLEDAAEIMEESMIRRLVVVENGQLVGMVSLGDVAECDADEAEDVLVEVSKSEKTLAHKRRD
ncbi:MAG: CBS domain-containing protein, partial [Candidatus Sericytochromatia bacterium]